MSNPGLDAAGAGALTGVLVGVAVGVAVGVLVAVAVGVLAGKQAGRPSQLKPGGPPEHIPSTHGSQVAAPAFEHAVEHADEPPALDPKFAHAPVVVLMQPQQQLCASATVTVMVLPMNSATRKTPMTCDKAFNIAPRDKPLRMLLSSRKPTRCGNHPAECGRVAPACEQRAILRRFSTISPAVELKPYGGILPLHAVSGRKFLPAIDGDRSGSAEWHGPTKSLPNAPLAG